MTAGSWHVYILQCADGTLYTGSTNDLERRVREHNTLATGARYTRSRRPVLLVYSATCPDRGAALRQEAHIKGLSRQEKLALAGVG